MASLTGNSVKNDAVTLESKIDTVTGKASTLAGDVTLTKTSDVSVATGNNFYNVNLDGGDDTLVGKNVAQIFSGTESLNTGFNNVNMGAGNDYLEFDKALARSINMGTGNDTAIFNSGGTESLNAGDGNDVVQLDFTKTTEKDLDNPDKVGRTQTYDGAGGADTLELVGQWSMTLGQGQFGLDTNGDGKVDKLSNSIDYQNISQVLTQPTMLSGTVRWPPSVYVNGATGSLVRAEAKFTNFEGIRVVCFVAGSEIETDHGPVLIEDLRAGDMVETREGFQPIRWIGKRTMDVIDLMANTKMLPVRIPAGAFGNGLPKRSVMFSPQHRIVVRSQIAERMFGVPEVLVTAKQLIGINGINTDASVREVEYYHIMLDHHHVVKVEGIEAETLYPGPQALSFLSEDAIEELRAIFPNFDEMMADENNNESYLTIIKGRESRSLIARHNKNNVPLYY